MHHPMHWGHGPYTHYSKAGMDMDVPLIPAPVAFLTLVLGLCAGVMIGHHKALVRCGQPGMTGHGMGMGMGMGRGMGMGAGQGEGGDWKSRKKAMMRSMMAHHHHGYGSAPCTCAEGQAAEMPEEAETAP